MVKKIKSFFEKHKIGLKNKKLCVCFSGGADSVALLSAMCELKETEVFSLSAVHVNHNIRVGEADRDEEFCISFCKEKGVRLFVRHVYAPETAKSLGCGLEEAARKLRYGVFESLKSEEDIDYFLTAHHGNDTAETVVFNMLRGCGVTGLAGIPHVRDIYLRPLIECTRKEIISYLGEKGESYVEDSTNKDETYTRNYIRHTLFADFSRVNPDFLHAILRLSESARQDEDYFAEELAKISEDDDLSLLHPSVASRAICKRYAEISGGEGLGFSHVKQILSCLSSAEEKSIDVPFGIRAYVKDGKVIFEKNVSHMSNWEKGEIFPVSHGETVLESGIVITAEKKYRKIEKFSDEPLQIVIDRSKIKGELFARKRMDGDKLLCRGIRRSISKELINLKIPKRIRDAIPVICDSSGAVFVPFIGADDRVFASEQVTDPVMITVDLSRIYF